MGIWLSLYEYVSPGRRADIHQRALRPADTARSQYSDAVTQRVKPFEPDHGPHAKRRSHHRNLEREDQPERILQGSVYHGALQFLLDPTGRRMKGQWVGYGRDFDLNTGPWNLELVSSDTSKDAIAQFNRLPESASTAQDDNAK
jgi:hypothetical protein